MEKEPLSRMAEPMMPTTAASLEPPPARALPVWPADSLPSACEAERAVRAVLRGSAGALDPTLASRLSSELTEIERAAFDGCVDESASSVRAAAALRWRLGAAVVTAPERGPVDGEAVAQLLADADAVLGALQASAEGAPPAFAEAVAGIRKGLVADAISLQNAVQRLGATAPQAAAAAAPKAAEARLLSVMDGELHEPASERRSPGKLWALLVVAALGAGGWHAYSWMNRPPPPAPPAEGAPAGMVASAERAGRMLLVTQDGRPLPAADLERLQTAQRAKGKRVVELSRGVYAVESEGASARR